MTVQIIISALLAMQVHERFIRARRLAGIRRRLARSLDDNEPYDPRRDCPWKCLPENPACICKDAR